MKRPDLEDAFSGPEWVGALHELAPRGVKVKRMTTIGFLSARMSTSGGKRNAKVGPPTRRETPATRKAVEHRLKDADSKRVKPREIPK